MAGKHRLITAVASLLLVSSLARADSFDLSFTAGSAAADPGGLVQIGYSFTSSNPNWGAVVSQISPELPGSDLISCPDCPFTQRFVVDRLSTLSSPTGLFDFSWAKDAPRGYSFTGPVSALVVWVPHDPRLPFTGVRRQINLRINSVT